MEVKEEIYKQLLQRGQQILAMTPEGQDSTTELDLRNLQDKWECVQAKAMERKVRIYSLYSVSILCVLPVSLTHHHHH